MNVHGSSSGIRRAAARRALRRYGAVFWDRLPAWPFEAMLARVDDGLIAGSLELHLPDGTVRILGGRQQGFTAIVHVDSWRALVRLAMSGSVGWYRAWAAGEWSSPDAVTLFALFSANARSLGTVARARGVMRLWQRLWTRLRAGKRPEGMDWADSGSAFHAAWLDGERSLICARPAYPSEPFDVAQKRAIDDIIYRIDIKNQSQILEITNILNSSLNRALDRMGIAHARRTCCLGRLTSATAPTMAAVSGSGLHENQYNQIDTREFYNSIVSVESIETVGQAGWGAQLAAIARMLKPGGRAVIQFISIDDAIFPAYARRADFVQHCMLPGSSLVSEKRFRALAEAQGLTWTDQARFGLDYAWTLRHWRERFDAAVDAGKLPRRFDVRVIDRWRYFLMYCEGGFAGRSIDVTRVTLVKPAE